ncbi:ABC transporter substrate-binding protein [Salinicoccus cyprini]|uniref:ABC transporter substrate-binding protein n=1 Tax=Salinicoccus cyprini TaxID=2493691 RepID=A0A558ASV2_9STAP|nr:ABC transporter substrate-binding protein [Salinicoccus cyprini]TVT27353.1 ABC transporter substrate-binding protein [Salinicoccus cyprini]
MKKFISIIALMMVLVLAACSNSGESTEESAEEVEGSASETSEETSAESSEASGGMVSYTTDGGEEIEIPEDPQRVVVMATSYFGNVMQLDANVVGAHARVTESDVLEPYTEDIELVEEGNIEQVMNLDPDLIIAFNSDENLDKLKAIAPTVPIDYAKWNYLDIHRELGKITNTEEKAEEWIAGWEAELEENKAAVEEAIGADATASVIEQYAKDIYVYGTNWGRGTEILYQGLGVDVPEAIQNDVVETGWKAISAEEIEKYSGDYMFVGTGDSGADNAYRDTAVWENLEAVQNDRVVEFDSPTFYYNDPYSLEYQKDIIMEALTK